MENEQNPQLNQLIHDVRSKCSSLISAAEMLRKSSPEKAQEMLKLMVEQVHTLENRLAKHVK
ncbi:hypothetical protein ACFL6Y_05120 [Elusimicrobiota bacterium]